MDRTTDILARSRSALPVRAGERGVSRTRLLLSLGLIALAFVGGYAFLTQTLKVRKTSETIELIQFLKLATQRSFQGRPTYGRDNLLPELCANGTIDICTRTRHPWDGPIHLSGNDQSFRLSLEHVPGEACIEIGAAYETADPDFISLTISGKTMEQTNSEAFTKACGAGEPVAMVWEFF